MIKKLSVGRKISLGFGILLLFMGVVGIIGYQAIKKISFQVKITRQVDQIVSELTNARLGQADFMITDENRFVDINAKLVKEAINVAENVKSLMEIQASKDKINDIEKAVNTYSSAGSTHVNILSVVLFCQPSSLTQTPHFANIVYSLQHSIFLTSCSL